MRLNRIVVESLLKSGVPAITISPMSAATTTRNGQIKSSSNLCQGTILKGRLSTMDLRVLTSIYKLLLILQTLFTFFYKTSYLNEEVNRNEPFPFN